MSGSRPRLAPLVQWPHMSNEAIPSEKNVLAPARLGEKTVLLLVTAVVLLLDQFSKYMVEAFLPLYTSWSPWPSLAHLFQFTHATNTGAAFGIFPGGSLVFTLVALAVVLFILVYNYTLPGGQWLLRLGLGLQLGGALGNLLDRLRLGHVTDFLDFGPWPVFNLADTAIVVGVVVLAWLMLQEWRADAARSAKAGAERQPDDVEFVDEWSTR